MGISVFVMSGEIKNIQVFDKNPERASAVMLVQTGPSRERGNRPVEFVNAVKVRVPPYRYAKLKNRLKVGEYVYITGKIQGILKMNLGEGLLDSEHVAEHIDFEEYADVESAESAAEQAAA